MTDIMITAAEFDEAISNIMDRIKAIETVIEKHLIEYDKEKRFKQASMILAEQAKQTINTAKQSKLNLNFNVSDIDR